MTLYLWVAFFAVAASALVILLGSDFTIEDQIETQLEKINMKIDEFLKKKDKK